MDMSKRKVVPLTPEQIEQRLFRGCFPAGFSWCDRAREDGGDWKRIAFLSYRDLEFTVYDKRSPLLEAVRADAAALVARRGEEYNYTVNQRIKLGYGLPGPCPGCKSTNTVKDPALRCLACGWSEKMAVAQ